MIQKAVIAPWVGNSGICKEIKINMIQKLKYIDQEISINKIFHKFQKNKIEVNISMPINENGSTSPNKKQVRLFLRDMTKGSRGIHDS